MKIGNLTGKRAVAVLAAAAVIVAAASSGVTYLVVSNHYESDAEAYERRLDAAVDAYDRILDRLDDSLTESSGEADDALGKLDDLADGAAETEAPAAETGPEETHVDPPVDRSEQPGAQGPSAQAGTGGADEPTGMRAVPNVLGFAESLAYGKLEEAGFCVSVAYAPSDTFEKGNVMDFQPQGSALPIGTTITITVSTGPASSE